ncbi:MAG TPA: EcsC family protein [Candidatus Acidoferrales bacterium]|nr:EcsC family protein [Candidatus Acidoferrales bacterium]
MAVEKVLSDKAYRLLRASSRAGFRHAYKGIRLDPQAYFEKLKRRLNLPAIHSWQDLQYLNDEELNPHADRVIRMSSRLAALEGAGLGLGGLAAALPDFGILAAVTVRMLQKLSVTYGFDYSSDEELVGLWLAAASAAGLDLGRDFLGKQAMERLVPKIVDAVALKAGAEVAETIGTRVIPILSAGAAGALNYWFVKSWGRRAQRHFLNRRGTIRVLPGPPRPYLLRSPLPS